MQRGLRSSSNHQTYLGVRRHDRDVPHRLGLFDALSAVDRHCALPTAIAHPCITSHINPCRSMDEPLPLRRQRVLRLIECPATSTAAAVRSRTIRKQPLRTRTSDGRFDRTAASSPALIVVFLSKERSVGHALRLVSLPMWQTLVPKHRERLLAEQPQLARPWK